MQEMSQNSMLDIAYDLMSKKKKPVDFYKLYEEVSEIKGFNSEDASEHQSLFYTNITLDGRFITVGENQWDLRSRHKFENVHIDMNDIYNDDETEEADAIEETEEDSEEEEVTSEEDEY